MDNRLLWVVFFMILQNATLCPRVVMQSNFGNGNNTLHTKKRGIFVFKKNWQYFLYKTPYIFSFEFPKFSILLQKILKSFSENSQKCNKKTPIVRLFLCVIY